MFDTNGTPVSEDRYTIPFGASETRTRRILCKTGQFLRCETAPDLTVEAQHVGDTAWTDIEASPLDLSAWNGTLQDFNFRITAATPSGYERQSFRIYVQ